MPRRNRKGRERGAGGGGRLHWLEAELRQKWQQHRQRQRQERRAQENAMTERRIEDLRRRLGTAA